MVMKAARAFLRPSFFKISPKDGTGAGAFTRPCLFPVVEGYLQSGKAFIALSASSFVLYTFIPTSIIFFPSGFFITTLHLFEVVSFAT